MTAADAAIKRLFTMSACSLSQAPSSLELASRQTGEAIFLITRKHADYIAAGRGLRTYDGHDEDDERG